MIYIIHIIYINIYVMEVMDWRQRVMYWVMLPVRAVP